jgi:hypothetical protein
MANVHYLLDATLTRRLEELPITPSEREHAQANLELAMKMADLALRATAALRKYGRTFAAVLTSRRDFVRDGVLRSD